MPSLFARASIDGVDHAPRRDAVEHAVEDQRSSFLAGLGIAARGGNVGVPAESQPVHVLRCDLVELAKALFGPAQVVANPLFGQSGSVAERLIVYLAGLLGHRDPGSCRSKNNRTKSCFPNARPTQHCVPPQLLSAQRRADFNQSRPPGERLAHSMLSRTSRPVDAIISDARGLFVGLLDRAGHGRRVAFP